MRQNLRKQNDKLCRIMRRPNANVLNQQHPHVSFCSEHLYVIVYVIKHRFARICAQQDTCTTYNMNAKLFILIIEYTSGSVSAKSTNSAAMKNDRIATSSINDSVNKVGICIGTRTHSRIIFPLAGFFTNGCSH